jgi:hypothetical protein
MPVSQQGCLALTASRLLLVLLMQGQLACAACLCLALQLLQAVAAVVALTLPRLLVSPASAQGTARECQSPAGRAAGGRRGWWSMRLT